MGTLVVFEGPEGAGKSTQVRALATHLTAHGLEVVATREPGGTSVGDAIRSILLDPHATMAPSTEFLLYASARAQHVDEIVRPALERGAVVVSDRFAASSVAYQSFGRGLDRAFVDSVNRHATQGIEATLTILLDLDPAVGLQRVRRRGAEDRLEQADLSFHTRVREGFLQLAREQRAWHVIDASATSADVSRQVAAYVDALVLPQGGDPA